MKKLEDTPLRISRRKAAKLRMERHREKVLAERRGWYAKNREKVRAWQAAYNLLNKDKLRIARAASYQRNKKKIDARNDGWRKANQERVNARSMSWYLKNKEKAVLTRKNYALSNPERVREQRLRNYAKNSDRYTAALALYRAKKRKATPVWANSFFIGEAYHLAKLRTKMLGFPWHVDHIVPLKSKRVCGLHVENNLRVIPSVENIRKGNHSWPNMP
jgi:hypothetical protein